MQLVNSFTHSFLLSFLTIFQQIVLEPVETFELEDDEFFFSHPVRAVHLQGKHLYLIERDSSSFIVLNLENKSFVRFGNNTAAPSGISSPHAFFVNDQSITVLSSMGKKITHFSKDGDFLKTERSPYPVFYVDTENRIFQQGAEFVFEFAGNEIHQSPFFDASVYGFSRFALASSDHFVVAAIESNSNQFEVHHFDLKQKKLTATYTKDKVQKVSFEDIPMAKEAGFTEKTFFLSILKSIAVADELFYFIEFVPKNKLGPAMEEKSLVHQYNPDEKRWQKHIVSHPGVQSTSFILPSKNGKWIGFDTVEDQFFIMKERK
jgi:hypothetical protein